MERGGEKDKNVRGLQCTWLIAHDSLVVEIWLKNQLINNCKAVSNLAVLNGRKLTNDLYS